MSGEGIREKGVCLKAHCTPKERVRKKKSNNKCFLQADGIGSERAEESELAGGGERAGGWASYSIPLRPTVVTTTTYFSTRLCVSVCLCARGEPAKKCTSIVFRYRTCRPFRLPYITSLCLCSTVLECSYDSHLSRLPMVIRQAFS
jgi:hypothetical protein